MHTAQCFGFRNHPPTEKAKTVAILRGIRLATQKCVFVLDDAKREREGAGAEPGTGAGQQVRHRSRGSPRPASVRRRSRGSPRPAPRPHPRCGPPPRRHARPGPPPGGALALAPPAEEGAPAPVPGGGHRGRPVAAADTAARAWNSPAAGQELAGGASARRGGRESSPPKPRRTRRPRRAGSLCSAGRALAGRHRALARGASPALAGRHRAPRGWER